MGIKLAWLCSGMIAILCGVVWWQNGQIVELNKSIQALELSNESLKATVDIEKIFSEGIGQELQSCLDSKGDLASRLNYVSRKYREAQSVPIDKGEVINDELLKELVEELNKPLPNLFNDSATDGVRNN